MALIPPGEAQPIGKLDASVGQPLSTGISELDRVLDGGLVPGSVTLLGGEPGIGKSTLLLQLLASWPTRSLYVTAEESAQQVRLRAERLHAVRDNLWLVSEPSLTNIVAALDKVQPELLVIDSIQAVADPALGSAPGSAAHTDLCKKQNAATFQRSWLAMSPKMVGSLGHACSSMLSTLFFHLKENDITHCASCAQSNIVLVLRMNSDCLR
jgi:predicted ATP-dependent serine protease